MRFIRPAILTALIALAFALPPVPLPKAYAAGGQVSFLSVCRTTAPSTTVTNYNGYTNGPTPWQTIETDNQGVWPGPGPWTIKNYTVRLTTDPTNAGSSYAFTIEKTTGAGSPAATAVTVTIAAGSTIATDSTHTASFAAGDRIDIKCVPSATAPAATGNIEEDFEVDAPSANQFPLIWSSAQTHTEAAASTYFMPPSYSGISTAGGAETDQQVVCPTGGTISQLYAQAEVDPGNGNTVAVTVDKNAVAQTVTCTITGNGTTGVTANDTAHSFTVVAGDLLAVKFVTSAAITSTRVRFGMLFAPTVGSEGVLMGILSPFAQATTNFSWNPAVSNSTESNVQVPVKACTWKKLYLDSSNRVPASGQTLTLTVDKASVATAITAQATNGAPTANDTAHTSAAALNDLYDIKIVSSATAGLTAARYGIVFDVPQAAAGRPSNQLLQGVGSRPRAPFFPVGAN